MGHKILGEHLSQDVSRNRGIISFMPTIFVIVVTYNGRRWYDRCLGSLLSSEIPLKCIVIDNASSDDTVDYIRQCFPETYIIESNENLGFAKANNIGIRYAVDHGADYVFLLNQDAWVEKNTMTELIKTFEDIPNVGIASPIHLNGDYSGLDSRFCESMPWRFLSDSYMQKPVKYYPARFINAAAWLISRRCLEEIGGFDTSLFTHCGEDNNYCQRLRYHGFSIIVNSQCTICHDREYRDPNNDVNRREWREVLRKEEIAERWSDINSPFDMPSIIKQFRRRLFVSRILCKKDKIGKYTELIDICKKVKASRETNIQVGMNWL